MPNPITKTEAQFRLRNITAKLAIAQSAAREGDWRIAFDNAYEAQDLLDTLLPHLEEALDELANRRDVKPEPEPPGSLKYGVPPGTPSTRVGGMGYRGSNHDHRGPEPITIDVTATTSTTPKPRVDLRPPKPIITPPPPIAKPIITPPPIIPQPPKPPAPKPAAPKPTAPAIVIPEGAEVVTLEVDRLLNGVVNDAERAQMTLLFELPEAFRKEVLKSQALSRRPVTIFRVGDGAWSIFK